MTPKQEAALRQALEALEWNLPVIEDYGDKEQLNRQHKSIATIYEALADNALDKMADNAKELGLDYEPIVEQVEDSVGMGHGAWDMVEPKKLAKAFHEALAEQPAQPSKPLTDAQIGAVAADIWGSILIAPQSYQAFARAIEAKLREKNA